MRCLITRRASMRCRARATVSAWRSMLACAGRVECAWRCGLRQNVPACWRSYTSYAEGRSFAPLRFGFVIVGVFFCLLFDKGMAMPAKPRKKPPPQTTSDYLSTLEHAIRQLAYGQHLFTTFRHFVELSAISLSNVADRDRMCRIDGGQSSEQTILQKTTNVVVQRRGALVIANASTNAERGAERHF